MATETINPNFGTNARVDEWAGEIGLELRARDGAETGTQEMAALEAYAQAHGITVGEAYFAFVNVMHADERATKHIVNPESTSRVDALDALAKPRNVKLTTLASMYSSEISDNAALSDAYALAAIQGDVDFTETDAKRIAKLVGLTPQQIKSIHSRIATLENCGDRALAKTRLQSIVAAWRIAPKTSFAKLAELYIADPYLVPGRMKAIAQVANKYHADFFDVWSFEFRHLDPIVDDVLRETMLTAGNVLPNLTSLKNYLEFCYHAALPYTPEVFSQDGKQLSAASMASDDVAVLAKYAAKHHRPMRDVCAAFIQRITRYGDHDRALATFR